MFARRVPARQWATYVVEHDEGAEKVHEEDRDRLAGKPGADTEKLESASAQEARVETV
jgi:hypothetical protein